MADWSSGYVSEIDYTHGYYSELCPVRAQTAVLTAGYRAPALTRICELGCGQGFSSNLHAAANPGIEFHATDFNPGQIANARALAADAGTHNVTFYDTAFADFAEEPGLPDQFDVIALHGIYSWISPENRQAIIDFIAEKLAIGGLVYISYNALPGWAAAMPLRRLMVDHAARSNGPILPRIGEALDFADKMAGQAKYFTANPVLKERLEKLKGQSRHYLAHEYFNRDWTPFYFADVAADMAEAKLSFVGSAHIVDQIDAINLTKDQQALLSAEPDRIRREGLKDFIINQQFRRDVYIKGPQKHDLISVRDAWSATRFALSIGRDDVPMKVTGALGEADLQPDVYTPLLDALADGPASVEQMMRADKKIADLGWPRLMQAMAILSGSGNVHPCLPVNGEADRAARTRAFNAAVCARAKTSTSLNYLASPVTGGGIPVDRFGQLFLGCRRADDPDPVASVWSLLKLQNQRVVKDGKPLQTEAENVTELKQRLAEFEENRLPVLMKLGIA